MGSENTYERYFFHSDAARPRMLRKNNTFRRGEPGGMLPKSNTDVAETQHIVDGGGRDACSAECGVKADLGTREAHGQRGAAEGGAIAGPDQI